MASKRRSGTDPGPSAEKPEELRSSEPSGRIPKSTQEQGADKQISEPNTWPNFFYKLITDHPDRSIILVIITLTLIWSADQWWGRDRLCSQIPSTLSAFARLWCENASPESQSLSGSLNVDGFINLSGAELAIGVASSQTFGPSIIIRGSGLANHNFAAVDTNGTNIPLFYNSRGFTGDGRPHAGTRRGAEVTIYIQSQSKHSGAGAIDGYGIGRVRALKFSASPTDGIYNYDLQPLREKPQAHSFQSIQQMESE
ncbi:hypothetical protein HZU83_13565 [Sphaerotilus montanus]|uniref:Uncharacterized protein n=1 Tax=Sphaerotilus montanus TaxID=522889 RepID=A0A7Y9QWT0_9BURK|nr:hypothetical protein [Sphaerotilus montanus]NYG32913.1 hypothetical protein [Sphaerotilus montanus]NZD57718.1 hypothetical protein [Sphaerotilus montanus]